MKIESRACPHTPTWPATLPLSCGMHAPRCRCQTNPGIVVWRCQPAYKGAKAFKNEWNPRYPDAQFSVNVVSGKASLLTQAHSPAQLDFHGCRTLRNCDHNLTLMISNCKLPVVADADVHLLRR